MGNAPEPALSAAAQGLVTLANEEAERAGTVLGVFHWLFAVLDRYGGMAESSAEGLVAATAMSHLRGWLRRGETGLPLSRDAVVQRAAARMEERCAEVVTEHDIVVVILRAAGYTVRPGGIGADQRQPKARLILHRADGQRTIELRPVTSIGRNETHAVPVNDSKVSKDHCVIEFSAGGWTIRDLGSANGTFVNGERVQKGAALRHGDEITLGDTKARFEDDSAPAAPAGLTAKRSATPAWRPRAKSPTPVLNAFARDLTHEAAAGTLPPVVGRKEETALVLETLCRRTKRNPMLLGPAGVGKTAIVEGLAVRIVRGDVPELLRGVRLFALSLGALVAEAGRAHGELEKRVMAVLAEASQDGILLFIDEVHAIVGAGGAAGRNDVASQLKPALARGEIACIAATTDDEYRRFIEPDPALERRFQPIRVREMTPEQTLDVMFATRDELAKLRGVSAGDDVVRWLVGFAKQFLRNRHFPDKGVDLLEQCVAYTVSKGKKVVELDDAEAVAQRMIGMPVALSARTGKLHKALLSRGLLAEEDATRLVERLDVTMRGLDLRPARPNAVVLLLGDATQSARALSDVIAEALFGASDRVVAIDFASYVHPADTASLIGARPGYIGYSDTVALHRVAEMPWCVLRLDNVHGCHDRVREMLVQMLAEGSITDSRGKRIYLSDVVVIATAPPVRGVRLAAANSGSVAARFADLRAGEQALGAAFMEQCDLVCSELPSAGEKQRGYVQSVLLAGLAERWSEHGLSLAWDVTLVDWLIAQAGAQASPQGWERLIDGELTPVILPHLGRPDGRQRSLVVYVADGKIEVGTDAPRPPERTERQTEVTAEPPPPRAEDERPAPAPAASPTTRAMRLLSVWGSYAWKGWSTLTDVLCTPDGSGVWTLGHDLHSTLWDAVSGEPLRRFPLDAPGAEEHAVPAVGAITPDGARLLVGRYDGSLALYDLGQGARLWKVSAVDQGQRTVPVIRCIAVSRSGRLAATAAAGELAPAVRVWDVARGVEIQRVEGAAATVAFLPSEQLLVDGKRVIDAATSAVAYEIPGPSRVTAAACSSDGAHIVIGDHDGNLWCWETAKLAAAAPPAPKWKGQNTNAWGEKSPIDHAAISHDGSWVFTVSTLSHQHWALANGLRVSSSGFHGTWRVTYAPDASRAFGIELHHKRICHFDMIRRGEVRPPYEHEETITCLAISPDGRLAVTGSRDRTARLWDVATGRPMGVLSTMSVNAVAFSADGRRVFVGDEAGGSAYDVSTRQRLVQWSWVALKMAAFVVVAPTPDATGVVFCDADGSVLRWDLQASREVWRRTKAGARRATFSTDGSRLVVTTAHRTLEIWDAESGATLSQNPVPDRLKTQPQVLLRDGRTVLAIQTEQCLALRDLPSGAEQRRFPGSQLADGVLAVCPHERLAVTATARGTLQLWDIPGASLLDTFDLASSSDTVTCAAFLPDGRALLAGTTRGVVLRFAPI
ncbi:FHA domain-containing protein [Sorangium sp. So ce204]|uniref:FHA domain-containing protein n=1 Tax=Sorangium sp. So ce204 TaxID=3133288 RepID=UPI003F618286